MIRNRGAALVAAILVPALLLSAAPAVGHSPDPVLAGALFAQNQSVHYRWKVGEAPPAAMQTAINTAAGDVARSRLSRAATFVADSAGASSINYGLNVACGVNGLACFSRVNAPASFTMSFREQGHVFDWGALRWCQLTANAPNGCYDIENIALDEFGHVEILNHHVDFDDDSDYLDAVVQALSHTKPNVGWNAHSFGRCDIASLQRKYDIIDSTTKYSTCLDLQTTAGLAASSTFLSYGGSVTFTVTLTVVDLAEYEKLGGNPISARSVVLQRRPIGGAWTTVATMPAGATSGTYVYKAVSQTATADWRAVFAKPASEGLRGDTSPTVTVSVSTCRTPPCPLIGGATR
ncbi:MAG: hypothetical protein ACJ77B_06120 [Chloroflexota bacterium]